MEVKWPELRSACDPTGNMQSHQIADAYCLEQVHLLDTEVREMDTNASLVVCSYKLVNYLYRAVVSMLSWAISQTHEASISSTWTSAYWYLVDASDLHRPCGG